MTLIFDLLTSESMYNERSTCTVCLPNLLGEGLLGTVVISNWASFIHFLIAQASSHFPFREQTQTNGHIYSSFLVTDKDDNDNDKKLCYCR